MALFREMRRIYSKLARKLGRNRNSKTKQDLSANILVSEDLFANIPPEIMVDILSRLPIPSVLSCKCVCKSWMNLVENLEFANLCASKSFPALAIRKDRRFHGHRSLKTWFHGHRSSKTYQILELVDTQNSGSHPLNVVLKFNFEFPHIKHQILHIHSSANGLLLMLNKDIDYHTICNPVTREYIKLPSHPPSLYHTQANVFGFGVSKVSGKYKVVRMSLNRKIEYNPFGDLLTNTGKCEVYTLGTGSWRRVAAGGQRRYWLRGSCIVSNGNLHWLVRGRKELGYIWWGTLVFDLEKEHFSTFSIPVCCHSTMNLCTWRGSLCLCSNDGYKVEIWWMNKYGDDKSWRKEFVIENIVPRPCRFHMSEDGDIIFATYFRPHLYCYSSKNRTVRVVAPPKSNTSLGSYISFRAIINYSPTFLPLKTFTMGMEDVTTF